MVALFLLPWFDGSSPIKIQHAIPPKNGFNNSLCSLDYHFILIAFSQTFLRGPSLC